MKPLTIDMLRAHLMAASLTATGAEVVICLALLIRPVSDQTFSSASFRLIALAVVVCGVIAMRRAAHTAFDLAVRSRHATAGNSATRPVSVAANCPRRWFVILHLRFTRRPFVLAEQ